eukprot:TRINITY_DN7037_c0_g1_i1.p1 TRINITY_DN7037_c0_g1~~TRINITY_DN7037_c0_g1_i1.p1  ORF type:complete len:587 (-),score=130.38 TRINITY_DN7037_c0_g1_i1:115-1875(-)
MSLKFTRVLISSKIFSIYKEPNSEEIDGSFIVKGIFFPKICENMSLPPKSSNKEYLTLCEDNDVKKLVEIFDDVTININYQDEHNKNSGIHYAVINNSIEMINFLIEKGINLEMMNEDNYTPLLLSTSLHFYDICKLLLDKGAKIDNCCENHYSPLFIACASGFNDLVDLFIENNANVEFYEGMNGKLSCLQKATLENRIDVITTLLTKEIKFRKQKTQKLLSYKNIEGNTALMLAVKIQSIEIVKLLLQAGEEICLNCVTTDNNMNEDRKDCLKAAVQILENTQLQRCTDTDLSDTVAHSIVQLLKENIKDPCLSTVENSFEKMKIKQKNINKETKKMRVIEQIMRLKDESFQRNRKEKFVTDLVKRSGASVIQQIQYEFIRFLTSRKNTSINSNDIFLLNDLFLLVTKNHDLNAQDEYGFSLLWHACRLGCLKIVRLLLNNNINYNLSDIHQVSPLFMCVQNEFKDIVIMLLEHGTNVNVVTDRNISPMFIAVQQGNLEIVELLLKYGAEPDICRCDDNLSPLHMAIYLKFNQIALKLINLDVGEKLCEIQDSFGCTPFNIAQYYNNDEIIDVLKNKPSYKSCI